MIAYLILGIALLAGILLAGQWYVNADPKSILRALKWLLVGLVLAVALYFVLSGRLLLALAAIPALLPWFFRLRQAARAAKAFHRMGGGGTAGQASTISTRFLDMTLNHATGEIAGTVREGPLAGRDLGTLTETEMRELHALCLSDDDSRRLLESYLDRHHPAWRGAAGTSGAGEGGQGGTSSGGAGGGAGGGGPSGAMSRAEALAVLGLKEGADEAAIKEAHRRLIANLHPDRGGSDYLAAKINEAKDTLLV